MRLKWQLAAVLCLLTAISSRCGAQTLNKTSLPSQAPVRTVASLQHLPRYQTRIASTPHGKLDRLLVKASASNATQTEVEQALDGIFQWIGVDSNMLGSSLVKNQIVSAELAYHNQHHAAISEDRIVTAINNISTAWGMPNYTRTSATEVRRLHASMVGSLPNFLLGDARTRLNRSPTERTAKKTIVRSEMSPLEATLTFSVLAFQKLYNPEYQTTPDEETAVSAARLAGMPSPQLQDRHAQVYAALRSSGSINRLPDLITQADKTMSDLGISGGAR